MNATLEEEAKSKACAVHSGLENVHKMSWILEQGLKLLHGGLE